MTGQMWLMTGNGEVGSHDFLVSDRAYWTCLKDLNWKNGWWFHSVKDHMGREESCSLLSYQLFQCCLWLSAGLNDSLLCEASHPEAKRTRLNLKCALLSLLQSKGIVMFEFKECPERCPVQWCKKAAKSV